MRKIVLLLGVLFVQLAAGAQPGRHWKAQWICATEDSEMREAPLLRKTFKLRKPLASAKLYSCGLGYSVTTINGKPIVGDVLDQAFTRYDKTVLYRSYDVTRLITSGQNCIGSELGNGWYNMQTHTIWYFDHIPWRKSPRLLLDLVLRFKDGTADTISTDNTWHWHKGPSHFNSMYAGEIYDARAQIAGWNLAGFNEQGWGSVMNTTGSGGALKPQEMPPVAVIREIAPKSVKALGRGRWVFDFGENFAGVARLTINGQRGDTISLFHNEIRAKDGSVDRHANTGHMIGPPSDPYFQTDQYILSGKGTEVFTPRFTYHGFRYIELHSSNPTLQIDKHTLKGLFYSTSFATAGTFTSSDPMLNKLYGAAIRSYRSNYNSIPTDCPAREKMGWTADAWVCAELGLWNFDAASSYRKYLGDIRDVQLPDGSFAGIAPTNRIGYHWIDPQDTDFGPCWGSAMIQLTNSIFNHNADTAVLRENYEAGKRYSEFIINKVRQTGYLYRTGLGDFLAIEETPKTITSSALAYQDLLLMARSAEQLHQTIDAMYFHAVADSIKQAFNTEYLDGANHTYKVNTLTALAIALECGLCPENNIHQVAAQLAAGVRSRSYQADFGVMGTRFVLRALSNHGYATEAYRLLTNTQAGWGRWIKNGATTLYEGWTPKDQSYNHVFFGDFAAWYYTALGGLSTSDGFQNILVKPVFPDGLKNISITHQVKNGEIRIYWTRQHQQILVDLTVPKGSIAHLELPALTRTLKVGTYHLKTHL